MKYSSRQYTAVLISLVDETVPSKHRETIRAFLDTLAKHGALPLLPEIVREFKSAADAKAGFRDVSIRAPDRLSIPAMARKLPFKARVNAICDVRLKGGAVMEVDGLRVDNSAAMRLERIREALTK